MLRNDEDTTSDPVAGTEGDPAAGIEGRIVRRSMAKREGRYSREVRRLLDAGLSAMRQRGTSARPRVADIVAAAGLSNEAFYRHFPSKDALVRAILEDGAERLRRYLAHQMAKETSREGQVRAWVQGVLAQAEGETAATTLAVLWNGSSVPGGLAPGRYVADSATLLLDPFAALGSHSVELHATLAGHATYGRLSDCLWQHVAPTRSEVDDIAAFCLAAVRAPADATCAADLTTPGRGPVSNRRKRSD